MGLTPYLSPFVFTVLACNACRRSAHCRRYVARPTAWAGRGAPRFPCSDADALRLNHVVGAMREEAAEAEAEASEEQQLDGSGDDGYDGYGDQARSACTL